MSLVASRLRDVVPRRADEGGQDRSPETGQDHRAARQRPSHRRSRSEHHLSVHRLGARHHRPPRTDHQDRAPAGHHPRQRDDGSGCGDPLPHRGPGSRHLRGAEPAMGSRATHAVGPAQRDWPARSTTRCHRATPPHAAARRPRQRDPAMGREGDAHRSEEHHPARRDPPDDGKADDGRAHPPRRRHHRRGREVVGDPARRGPEAVADRQRRRREGSGDPGGRGPGASAAAGRPGRGPGHSSDRGGHGNGGQPVHTLSRSATSNRSAWWRKTPTSWCSRRTKRAACCRHWAASASCSRPAPFRRSRPWRTALATRCAGTATRSSGACR